MIHRQRLHLEVVGFQYRCQFALCGLGKRQGVQPRPTQRRNSIAVMSVAVGKILRVSHVKACNNALYALGPVDR